MCARVGVHVHACAYIIRLCQSNRLSSDDLSLVYLNHMYKRIRGFNCEWLLTIGRVSVNCPRTKLLTRYFPMRIVRAHGQEFEIV